MEIAHHFLISTAEKHANPIRLIVLKWMQFKKRFVVATVDKSRELPIRITGEIGELAKFARVFIQAMNWHHWKELINRPCVWS